MKTKHSITGPLARILTETPLIEGRRMDTIIAAVTGQENQAAEPKYLTELRDLFRPELTVDRNGFATLPISGVLMLRPSLVEMYYYGAEDTEVIQGLVEQAAEDKDIRGLLLDIDSPGGYAVGIAELGDTIAAAAKKKPVVAYTNGIMASAAYWIASQATEIVTSHSAIVGSVGVYAAYYDYSARLAALGIKVEVFTNEEGKYKGAGIAGTSLSEEQKERIQDAVQEDFEEFKKAILAKRPGIPDEAMQGQTFSGKKAVGVKLTDHTGSQSFARLRLARLAAGK